MAGAEVRPAYTHEPGTLKKFLQHLDKCGKAQYNLICHKLVRDSIGQVTEISPEGIACLPLPTTIPSKKKYNSDNIAGYININAVKKRKRLQIIYTVMCSKHILSPRVQNIKKYRHTYTHTSTHAFLEVLCQAIDHMQRICKQHITLHPYTHAHIHTHAMHVHSHMHVHTVTHMHAHTDWYNHTGTCACIPTSPGTSVCGTPFWVTTQRSGPGRSTQSRKMRFMT